MDVVDCDKYIYMSSTSVYEPKQWNTVEEDFDGIGNELIWCDRKAFPYEQIKRQAEYALWQQYPEKIGLLSDIHLPLERMIIQRDCFSMWSIL